MKTKIKYKCISLRGDVVYIVEELEHPETNDHSGIMNFLDEQNKLPFMYRHDVMAIIDYEVYVEEPSIGDFLEQLGLKGQILLDAAAVFQKIKPILKDKPVVEQAKILMSHLNIGYEAAKVAYENINRILKGDSNQEQIENKPLLDENNL